MKYYKDLSAITDNNSDWEYEYFQNKVVIDSVRLFQILKKMKVDLTKQEEINSLAFLGETDKYKKSYSGSYKLFGKLGKTQKSTKTTNEVGELESVDFYEPEKDSFTHYKFRQVKDEEIIVEFYIQLEKK